MTRRGIPLIAARHLQEAIIGLTLMYGAEVRGEGKRAWRGFSRRLLTEYQWRHWGCFPQHQLPSSRPREDRCRRSPGWPRDRPFAMRLATTRDSPHHDIIRVQTTLGRRCRQALYVASARGLDIIERSRVGQGLVFPRKVHIHPPVRNEKDEEKEKRIAEAVDEARVFKRCPDTMWTDGSKMSQGEVGGGVAWYESRQ